MTGAPKETGASMLEGEGEDPMAAAGGEGTRGVGEPPAHEEAASGGEAPPQAAAQKGGALPHLAQRT